MKTHPRNTHPLTGEPIVPVGYRKPRPGELVGRPIWPMIGAAEDPPTDPPADPPVDPPADPPADPPVDPPKDLGFPADTPIADMTDKEQAAYWKHHAQKHETAWRGKVGNDLTPERVAEILAENEQHRQGKLTDNEKAIEQARAEGRAEAVAAGANATLDALIDVRLKQLEKKPEDFPLLDSLDRSKFITNDGDIDTDKVSAVLDSIIPLAGGDGAPPRWPATGQGNQSAAPQSGMDAGRAEAVRRGFIKPDEK